MPRVTSEFFGQELSFDLPGWMLDRMSQKPRKENVKSRDNNALRRSKRNLMCG